MGEVYQARDTRLGRDVALKVLPSDVAQDPERLARFAREAQTLAALNHPHIAAIYGLEESNGVRALVLELVEGPTLADRIAQGALPVEEALPIARQIALALQAAHEQGIIHRDLKPANIKIARDGVAKVLDFGLAKTMASARSRQEVSQSPTITTPAQTQAGIILGTAAYMAPEQVRGLEADKRSDVWAFGCVLYEMLAARRPFEGEDVSETLAAVLMREPDWTRLPPNLPRPIRMLLGQCLERDRRKRMADVAGALFAIEDAADAAVSPAPTLSPRARFRDAGWVVAALVAVAAAIVVGPSLRRAPLEAPSMRLQIVTPPTDDPLAFALSPDGQSMVFQSGSERGQLWLRRFESDEDRPLMGTEGAGYPFWSPDSRSVGFFADGALKRVDLAGGFVRTVAGAPNPRRGAWNSEGTILFGASAGPLSRVRADGGAGEEATALLPGQSSHRWPEFLPDGRHFLLLALGAPDVRGVYVGSLNSKDIKRIADGEPAFAFMSPTHLLITRQGALWAQKLSAAYTEAIGELLPVAPRVLVHEAINGYGALSGSSVGSFAYRAAAGTNELVWLDRSGRQVGALGRSDEVVPAPPRLSPDGRTVAVRRAATNGNTDLWLIDTARGLSRRFTFDPGQDSDPIFSPDGRRVVFASDPKDTLWDLYEQPADGTGEPTLLFGKGENENPFDWSSDGRYILFASQNSKTDYDLWALPLSGDRKPFPVAQTAFAEYGARFSPDAHFVAYQSNETGQNEVYVQPFPGPGAKVQISVGGGHDARWPHDGRELFYVAPDNRLMAVSVALAGSRFVPAAPRGLFALPKGSEYEPSHDGQRFLVNEKVSGASPITIVLNWKAPTRVP
jgi:hypothetical protein